MVFVPSAFADDPNADSTADAMADETPLELNFTADISAYGSNYKLHGGVDPSSDWNSGAEVSLESSLGWETGSLMHEVGVSFSADETSEQDSSQWTFTPGLEYSLMGSTFIVDASVDFDFSSDRDMLMGYMLWLQKKFLKHGAYSLSASGWIYYRNDGRILGDGCVNFRRFVKKGLGGKISLGAKVDADTLVSRVGPVAKTNVSYKFPLGFSLDWNENLFYGWVTETDYEGGFVMDMLKITGDIQLNWKHQWITLYMTLRSIYRFYQDIPDRYIGAIAQSSVYHSGKLGVKFSF